MILKNKIFRNASWIIICRMAQSVFSLIITMLTARYLGPSNYGVISYAASVVAFVVPIMQLGFNNVLVQETVMNPDDEGKIYGTSLTLSFISSIACIGGVISFSLIANKGDRETAIVCALYSILLLFQSLELIVYWFQAKYLSKYSAIVSLCAYAAVSFYKVFLLVSGKSIYWFAVSNAIDYMLISFALLIIYKRLGGKKLRFSMKLGVRLFQKSRYYIISSLMVTMFSQTDKIMLTLMKSDADTGYYTAAVTCAGITAFVFAAIIDSARPAIFEKQNEPELFELNMARLYAVIIYLSLLQSLGMTILAKPIIYTLYGSNYSPSIAALQIIVWYTTFSYLGAVRNIWILAEGKQKYLWIINLSGAIANIVLNFILIPPFGILGASVASLITQIFTNVIIGYIIKPLHNNNRIMLRALDPRLTLNLIKTIFRK